MRALDLFSAAAGGWTLGLHRAGFRTVAACEAVEWRRILYAENNPGVPIYDDVRTLTAARLVSDLGYLPDIVVGSPPCQDISSANTKGKGVEGARSGLFFEAVRIIGECRPRWFALENSHNLRTRGADAVIAALEAIDYACWPFVVRAGDIGANHERPRCWLLGCDISQVTDADRQLSNGRAEQSGIEGQGCHLSSHGAADRDIGRPDGSGAVPRRHGGLGQAPDAHENEIRQPELPGRPEPEAACCADIDPAGNTPHPDQARQAHGCMEPGLRKAEIADHGCGDGRRADRPSVGQVAVRPPDRRGADGPWPLWSLDDLAGRLRLDDGLPARLAGTRVAVGGPRGTAAASLIVEAYGDAVVPQIPEAIGRAILRTEAALRAILAPRLAA